MQRRTELKVSKFPYGRIGITVSTVILILCVIYFYAEWPEIKAMKPNEFGDLLAGVLGPLALLWLVLGFFQQGEELRHSVRALELQSEELRNSVEQQAALVEVTREQAKAEIEALHEDRRARKADNSPRFTVHASGGMQSGNAITQYFNVHNVGAMASDVSFELSASGSKVYDRFYSAFAAGEKQRIEWSFDLRERPTDLSINIEFKNRFGDAMGQILKLSSTSSLHSYDVEDITI